MSSPPFSQSHRAGSSSRPFQSSTFSSGLGSSSRPFLNMINPMGRSYKGYMQANQTVPEEDNENGSGADDSDLEAGRRRPPSSQSSAKAHGKQKVSSWNPGASEMNVFHPNTRKEEEDSSDDEVPKSFLVEASRPPTVKSPKARGKEPAKRSIPLHSAPGRQVPPANRHVNPSPVSIPPRPSEVDVPSEDQTSFKSGKGYHDPPRDYSMGGLDEYERALWNWVNVDNLDAFLQDVYYYYYGKGIYSIALDKGFKLLTVGFVTGFSTFLFGCIDYKRIHHQEANRLADVVIDRCVSKFSGVTFLLFILFIVIYGWQIVAFVLDTIRLIELYKFYTHLLKIPDADIQTISWPEVVRRIELIREENPITAISSKNARSINNNTAVAKLDAHDIANRIMRQENYLIAIFNKNLLDLRPPVPPLLKRFIPEEHGKGKTLSQALEWNIRFCLMKYLFNDQGKVQKKFLKYKNRDELVLKLQRRFIFMGILNMIFAPFIVFYFVVYSFFRYFEEYRKDPSTISGRRYTPYAQWKFREFNELPHIFARRLRESYPLASMYIGQFPNEKVTLTMRFVAFISGSFAAVLMAATIIDPDLFLHFEITPHRTVVFYLAISGTIMTVARGMIPDENRVFDPELLMSEVITYTHYMPDDWKSQLHSKRVHQEFGELFTMKIVILLQEILSVILTPFVLCYTLPSCAPAIIDFFHEFTVHVEGRGYVCSFAEFNFERHGNVNFGAPTTNPDKRMISNEGKMEKSFLNFKAANPDWNPTDPSGSLYLSRMAEFANHPLRRRHAPINPYQADMAATVHFAATPKPEASLTEKAQEYDRALRQSQLSATTRRRGPGSSSVMGASMMQRGMSASSMLGGQMMAQTAVLGDSQGSINPDPATTSASQETIGEDRGVGSGLDGSYVDGGRRVRNDVAEQDDEDELEDGGLLGLLAQIYGRKDGHAGGF